MLDRIGFAPEIGIIDSLSAIQTRGLGFSDQAEEVGSSFWNVLASEIQGTEESSRPSVTARCAETIPGGTKNGAHQGESVADTRDEKLIEPCPGKMPKEGAAQEHDQALHDDSDVERSGKNSGEGAALGQDAEPQTSTNPYQVVVCCQKGQGAEPGTLVADTLVKESAPETSHMQDKASDVTADVVGIGQSVLPLTVQLITSEENSTDQIEETGLGFESEVKPFGKKLNKGGPQAQIMPSAVPSSEAVEEANQTGGTVNQERATGDSETVSEQLRSAFPAVAVSGGQSDVIGQTVSRKKESAVLSGQDNGANPTVSQKLTSGTTEMTPQNAGLVTSYDPSVNASLAVSNERDERVKTVEGAKQEGAGFVFTRKDLARTEVSTGPKTGEQSLAQGPSMRADQAEQIITVQRVAQAIRLAHERNGEIRLRLHPPELGALRLQMRVQEGVLTARLEVETLAAREVLLDNIAGLRERLAEHQIRVEHFDVALMNDSLGGQTKGREEFLGSPHPRHRGVSAETKSSEEVGGQIPSIPTRRLGDRQFDVFI